MSASPAPVAALDAVGFMVKKDGLVLQYGDASFCLKKSGEIILSNKHSQINLSAFGHVQINARGDVTLNADHHIHLNTA